MPGQQHLTYRSPKEGLSPSEKRAFERRIGRAIEQGTPMAQLKRRFGVREARVREVAVQFNLQIVNARGKKDWR